MICLVNTPARRRQFCGRIAGIPFFGALLGSRQDLFLEKPGSGWAFYLLPGGAMTVRGSTAFLCGQPAQTEETAQFLNFLGVDTVLSSGGGPAGWREERSLCLFEMLPGVGGLTPRNQPQGLLAADPPGMTEIAAFLFADDPLQREAFYCDACTAVAHGMGRARLYCLPDGTPAATIGCYADWGGEAYLSAGQTAVTLRGRGVGGWMITKLAGEYLAVGRHVTLLCEKSLEPFYKGLGFARAGTVRRFTRRKASQS
jgi:GNAT superfamily N-acetyltransferase